MVPLTAAQVIARPKLGQPVELRMGQPTQINKTPRSAEVPLQFAHFCTATTFTRHFLGQVGSSTPEVTRRGAIPTPEFVELSAWVGP